MAGGYENISIATESSTHIGMILCDKCQELSTLSCCCLCYNSVGPRGPRLPPCLGGLLMVLHGDPAAGVCCTASSSHSGYSVPESTGIVQDRCVS